jgi:hypothetical protein
VKLSGGRIVEAVVKATTESTDGVRLQVSFGNETALIHPWQIVIEARRPRQAAPIVEERRVRRQAGD